MDPRHVCARPLLLGAALILAGCNLTNTDPPRSAHYKLTSDKPVMVITSKQFTVSGTEVALYTADTTTTSSKETTVSLDNPPLFLIRVVPLTATTNAAMKVDVGSKNWYDASRVISPPDKLEFVYGYTGSF